jgi:hypothetical protein
VKTKNKLNLFFILITLFYVSPLYASWYQVEVIVFENLSPSFDGELWYENPGLPDRSDSIEIIAELAEDEEGNTEIPVLDKDNKLVQQGKARLIPYLQLAEDKLRLDGVERVLKLSKEYRPLMHVSWQQPGLTAGRARPVHIQKFEEPEALMEEGLAGQEAEDIYQVLDLIFGGTIKLRSSRFLHVDVDIAYFAEFLSDDDKVNKEENSLFVSQQADYVRLQESRKIKLNEIHYFDHPLFGVMIRVSRLNLN